jgi:Tfp pilus assembly protein PilZ
MLTSGMFHARFSRYDGPDQFLAETGGQGQPSEGTTMSEDRKHERATVAYHAEVRRRDSGEIIGHLADVSEGGMMLTAEKPLQVGVRLALAVELPRQAGAGDSLPVTARVRWCEPDLAPGVYTVGLEYTGKRPTVARVGEQLVRLLGQAR